MALPGSEQPVIIKKKRRGAHGGGHGGAWKVAYADFVTAMMAFFLLLWLLSVTTSDQKKGIADYFAPVSMSRESSGSGGLLGGTTISVPGSQTSASAPISPDMPVTGPPGAAARENLESEEQTDPTFPKQKPGTPGQEFDIKGNARTPQPGEGPHAAQGAGPMPLPGQGQGQAQGQGLAQGQGAQPLPGQGPQGQGQGPGQGLGQGQGPGPQGQQGQQGQGQAEAKAAQEAKQFQEAAQQIRQAIQSIPDLQPLAQSLVIDQTPEGLRIQIVDQEKTVMFPSGGVQMYPQTKQLMALIAKAIGKLPNPLSISGHTDSTPFQRTDVYDNWDLSTERANASRRALVAAGIADSRIQTVVGRADRELLDTKNPGSPRNRRISIVLISEANKGAAKP